MSVRLKNSCDHKTKLPDMQLITNRNLCGCLFRMIPGQWKEMQAEDDDLTYLCLVDFQCVYKQVNRVVDLSHAVPIKNAVVWWCKKSLVYPSSSLRQRHRVKKIFQAFCKIQSTLE